MGKLGLSTICRRKPLIGLTPRARSRQGGPTRIVAVFPLGQSLHGKTAREVQQKVRRTVLIFDIILMKSAMALDVGHVIDDQPMPPQKRELGLNPRGVRRNIIPVTADKWLVQSENAIRETFRHGTVRMSDERTQQLDVSLANDR